MTSPRIVIVEARFYDHIADLLLAGARAELERAKMPSEVITVPGIFEVPGAVNWVIYGRERKGFEGPVAGVVTLGCAIRGETDHYDHICREAMRGLQDIVLATRLPLGNGILTVHDESQALARCQPATNNFGSQAARACLSMLALARRFSKDAA